MQCLQLCVSQFAEWQREREEEDLATPAVIKEGQEVLQSMVERMIKCEPEDFELVSENLIQKQIGFFSHFHL